MELVQKFLPIIVIKNYKDEKKIKELVPCDSNEEAIKILGENMRDLQYNYHHNNGEYLPDYGEVKTVYVLEY
jgi:hypothetical protein